MGMENSDLSEYEKIRLENIRRNVDFLSSIGISSINNKLKSPNNPVIKKENKNNKTLKRKIWTEKPTRCSKRIQGISNELDSSTNENEIIEEALSDDDEIHYEFMPESSDQLDDYEFEVFTFLKAWRLKRSRELEFEPYKICQNRTLAELIRRKRNNLDWAKDGPNQETDLLECWGIGASKAKSDGFGVDLIHVIENYEENKAINLLKQSFKLSTNDNREKEIILNLQ